MNKKILKILVVAFFLCCTQIAKSDVINDIAVIDNHDIRLKIEQGSTQKQRNNDSDAIDAADDLNGTQSKKKITSSLGASLYQAIQQKNWPLVRAALAKYEKTLKADPLLVNYAKGTLARIDGDYKKSADYLKKVIKKAPKNFLLPQLSLARVYFEDHQDKESQQTFKQLSRFLDNDNPLQKGVIGTVGLFNTALKRRQGWQGSIAISINQNNNINQSSGTTTCLQKIAAFCINKVTTPTPISAKSIHYEGVLSRRFALSGHHGAYVRGIAFGRMIKDNAKYEKLQGIFSAGYSYKDVNDEWSVAPTLNYSLSDGEKLYSAFGANAMWLHAINKKSLARIDISAESQKFAKSKKFNDGMLYSTNLGYWQTFGESTKPYVRLGWVQKNTEKKVNAYREKSLQLGVNQKLFNEFSVTAEARVGNRQYGQKNAILGIRQKDITRDYSLKIAAPHWRVMGLEPSLKIKYSETKSNVDWLYSHDKTEFSLRFEKSF